MIILPPLLTLSATTNFRYYNVCTIFSELLQILAFVVSYCIWTQQAFNKNAISLSTRCLHLKLYRPCPSDFYCPQRDATPQIFLHSNQHANHFNIPLTSLGFWWHLVLHAPAKLYTRAIHLNTTVGLTYMRNVAVVKCWHWTSACFHPTHTTEGIIQSTVEGCESKRPVCWFCEVQLVARVPSRSSASMLKHFTIQHENLPLQNTLNTENYPENLLCAFCQCMIHCLYIFVNVKPYLQLYIFIYSCVFVFWVQSSCKDFPIKNTRNILIHQLNVMKTKASVFLKENACVMLVHTPSGGTENSRLVVKLFVWTEIKTFTSNAMFQWLQVTALLRTSWKWFLEGFQQCTGSNSWGNVCWSFTLKAFSNSLG